MKAKDNALEDQGTSSFMKSYKLTAIAAAMTVRT